MAKKQLKAGDRIRVVNGGPYDGVEGEVVFAHNEKEETIYVANDGTGILKPFAEEDLADHHEVVRTVERRGGRRYVIAIEGNKDYGGVYHRTDFQAGFYHDEVEEV